MRDADPLINEIKKLFIVSVAFRFVPAKRDGNATENLAVKYRKTNCSEKVIKMGTNKINNSRFMAF